HPPGCLNPISRSPSLSLTTKYRTRETQPVSTKIKKKLSPKKPPKNCSLASFHSMAFHVACPITCRRICFCALGFPRDLHCQSSKSDFLLDVSRIEELLNDSSRVRASDEAATTVQVLVPKIVPPPPPATATASISVAVPAAAALPSPVVVGGDCGDEDSEALSASAHTKRVALQKKAAATMVAAEDFARRFESGDAGAITKDSNGEEQALSNTKVICRMCFSGESEGSERARKMLGCRTCGKKYHRSCVKSWSQHRDLFHWSSWNCPSCRTCEICRRTGDPNKFMFCKRCDGAYHCYCQHPPHKNVSSGPYLCSKHTRCHSCGSTVPGNGLSVRWFLGYTCCDACGRLFVKGNYCPVCLKVYRDSESTPMVCCDICQRWVHCHCDGISDDKYEQYQHNNNLQYVCTTCRGECYQVKDVEDAVQELWRRRDSADHDLIASLRAAAGLPTQEDIFSISPYSDDEDNGFMTPKNEFGRSLKFSLKGVIEKSPKKSKDHGKKHSHKKSSKKKSSDIPSINKTDIDVDQFETRSYGHTSDDKKIDDSQPHTNAGLVRHPSPVAGILNHTVVDNSVSQPGSLQQKSADGVMVTDVDKAPRVVMIKNNKPRITDSGEDSDKHDINLKTARKKLVINLGARKLNVNSSPKPDAPSCQKEQDMPNANGSEDTGPPKIVGDMPMDKENGTAKPGGRIHKPGQVILKFARRGSNLIKLGKVKEATEGKPKAERDSSDATTAAVGSASEVPCEKPLEAKQAEERPDTTNTETNDVSAAINASSSLPKDSKFSLKLKIKKPSLETQSSQNPPVAEEKTSSIRGQRSKRKRSSAFAVQDTEMLEASWVLKKLGKDAIGKRVEVHQPSESTWHKGTVSDLVERTSQLSVTLDDGRVRTVDLVGKETVRFVPQKQKR
ncbi:Histone-lysine N-methyltransferase 2B, partial [Linum grandiflorum]